MSNQWYVAAKKDKVPPGGAANGLVVDGATILMLYGVVAHGKYSNELYELQATERQWKKLKSRPPLSGQAPWSRLAHSCTLVGNRVSDET